MEAENYLDYIAQFSLVMITVSAAYLFDPSNLLTAAVFLFVPALFGYTAFASSESFRYSSLLSIFALVFLAVNKTAPVAVIVGIGNPLVSLFASGDSFKDYYGAVSIPMLLTGFILGTTVFLVASQNPEIRNSVQDTAAGLVSSQTSNVLEETEIIEQQKQANRRMIKGTSKASITMTQQYVINETQDFDPQDQQKLASAFSDAQREVPGRLINRTENQTQALNISERASDSVENVINKDNLILLVPIIGFGFYALHPILGLLTAIFGFLFSYLSSRTNEGQETESLNPGEGNSIQEDGTTGNNRRQSF